VTTPRIHEPNNSRPRHETNQTNQTNQTGQRNQPDQIDQTDLLGLSRVIAGNWKKGAIPSLWEGQTAERIVGQSESLPLAS
jgi:hypothetical protein